MALFSVFTLNYCKRDILSLCAPIQQVRILIMSLKQITSLPTYNPNRVLDAIIDKLQLKNDAALSRALEVAPPVISKIRHNTLPIGATILIRMHEISDFSIRELRELMAA